MEVFHDSDEVGADIVFLHGCPKRCMPDSVEGRLEICEDMGLHVLEKLFSQRIRNVKICSVVHPPVLKPACSSATIFSAYGFNLVNVIFSMTLLEWLMRLIVR